MGKDNLLNSIFESKNIKINNEEYTIKEMNGEEASDYESSMITMTNGKPIYNMKDAKVKLIQLTLHQNEKQLFEKKDIGLINKMPYSVINKIFKVASEINKLDKDNAEKN